jgi:hypothetical protein
MLPRSSAPLQRISGARLSFFLRERQREIDERPRRREIGRAHV